MTNEIQPSIEVPNEVLRNCLRGATISIEDMRSMAAELLVLRKVHPVKMSVEIRQMMKQGIEDSKNDVRRDDAGRVRGIGLTTKQIREAKAQAVFVWCNDHTSYPKALAKNLGRDDLEIVTPRWLLDDRWYGITRPVIFDHAFGTKNATQLSNKHWERYNMLKTYLRQRGLA